MSAADRKTYVLDTSVLLADPAALGRFAEHEVIIPVAARVMAASACVHSRLLYLAGTWPELSSQQLARLGAAYYRPLRIMAAVHKLRLDGEPPLSNVAERRQLAVRLTQKRTWFALQLHLLMAH